MIKELRKVLDIEGKAVLNLKKTVDKNSVLLINEILQSKGRVVVTAMGKSASIGRKFAASLASTGTPALFLHAGEGTHGDVGMVMKNDIVIALSVSGETDEIKAIVPAIKRIGARLACLTSKKNSFLWKNSDIKIFVNAAKEACPMNLAPTTSAICLLAVCDALTIALLTKRNFTKDDFALLHPAGALGKRLLLKVSDLMHTGKDIPIVNENETLQDVLITISEKRLGTAGVALNNKLKGVVTDGDIRRLFEKNKSPFNLKAKDIMTKNPKAIQYDELASAALYRMEKNKITSLFVLKNKNICGVIHIHDIIKSGVV